MDTKLLVPIADAAEWDWLEEDLMRAAAKAGFDGYDGGEEEGQVEVHFFDGMTPEEVQALVDPVLAKRAPKGTQARVTGDDEVTVQIPGETVWLRALGPVDTAYDRALRRRIKDVLADPAMVEWWAKVPYTRLMFHQQQLGRKRDPLRVRDKRDSNGDLLVTVALDITIMDAVKPSRQEVEEAARANLQTVLERVAEFVGVPLPPEADKIG